MAPVPREKTPGATVGGIKPSAFHESSTLAMGVATRLAYVGLAVAALWLCVWWALQ